MIIVLISLIFFFCLLYFWKFTTQGNPNRADGVKLIKKRPKKKKNQLFYVKKNKRNDLCLLNLDLDI